jgi:hypothetical protein
VETNVIARSDDHATTTNCNDLRGSSLLVVAAGDYVHEKTPLRSVFPLTSIAPTALTSHFLKSLPISNFQKIIHPNIWKNENQWFNLEKDWCIRKRRPASFENEI